MQFGRHNFDENRRMSVGIRPVPRGKIMLSDNWHGVDVRFYRSANLLLFEIADRQGVYVDPPLEHKVWSTLDSTLEQTFGIYFTSAFQFPD
jgi:hypothetical protein